MLEYSRPPFVVTAATGTEEGWVRRWFVLRRGNLVAFSGWGEQHTCLGLLVVKECSVEDCPEEAAAGAPFAFRVRER